MKILHIIRSVDPTQGGPVEALVAAEEAWRRLGHSREVVSLDLPDDPWVVQCPIRTHALGSAAVRRWTPHLPWLRYGLTPRLVPWLRQEGRRFDVIVVNGLWNFTDFAARRVLPSLGRPYFLFTHGMLDPWFRQAHPAKHWGKQLVWWLSEGPLAAHAHAVLFTSHGERTAAQGAFWPYRFATAIVDYGTAAPPPASADLTAAFRAAVPGVRRPYLLFLGRLHPKKGCDLLIRAYARLTARAEAPDLVIAGPDAGGWRQQLGGLAAAMGVAQHVHWPGMLKGDAKWGAFYGCEAFVLPSHGENFGVAVVEAMACGRPVLISDRVNIAPTIVEAQAGLVASDTVEGTLQVLTRFFALDDADRDAMGRRGRACFASQFEIEQVVHRTADLYARAMSS